jgi:hypothetical protein
MRDMDRFLLRWEPVPERAGLELLVPTRSTPHRFLVGW